MRAWVPAFAFLAAILVAGVASPGAPARGRRLSANDAAVKALLARMTLDEKIGQMTQAEQHQLVEEKDVETYFIGSLL